MMPSFGSGVVVGGCLLLASCRFEDPIEPCRRLGNSYSFQVSGSQEFTRGLLKLQLDHGKVRAALELGKDASSEVVRMEGGGRCLMGDLKLRLTGSGRQAALVAMMEPDLVPNAIGYLEVRRTEPAETTTAFLRQELESVVATPAPVATP